MKPTHPVDLICSAIATQEGWFEPGQNIPKERNNPGDLRFADQIGATRPNWNKYGNPPIATFTNAKLGITALYRQVWRQVAQGQTLREIINQWAPAIENNTTAYLSAVLQWTGLPADTPILDLLPDLVQLNIPTADVKL